MFPQLTRPELLQIVDLFVKQLKDRLLDRDMHIDVSPAARARLSEIGYDPTLGARPLRRAMQREIEDRLSERILGAELLAGDLVLVDYVDGEFSFHTKREQEKEHGEASAAAAAAAASTGLTPGLAESA